mmetsp:Transcript_14982/g.21663  ORF Transcript_14982/g.21663 Transcript_14982/m.21663 type:complete len:218 (+) Transcript_14982:1564-2217(+)
MASSIEDAAPLSMASLAALTAMGPFLTIIEAISIAFSCTRPGCTTCCTNPYSKASFASMIRPVNINSFARAAPMVLANRWVPPAPGRMASDVSGSPMWVEEDTTRRSAARASSRPPPRATPSMAAIVGMGRVAKSEVRFRRRVTKCWTSSGDVIRLRSFKSAPAQKTLGAAADVRIIQRVDESVCLCKVSITCSSSSTRFFPRALAAFGRLSVSVVI